MNTTEEVRGFFSKEHGLLVFLICLSLYANYKLYIKQNEILAENKLIIYRLNELAGKKQKNLAKNDFRGCKRNSLFQTPNSRIIGIRNNYRLHIENES